jgi:hypothetical protein
MKKIKKGIKMNEKEKRIQEQRTIEATKKNLMGLNGKVGMIVRNLGQPIVAQSEGGIFTDTNYLDDPWSMGDDSDGEIKGGTSDYVQSQIPYMEIDSKGTNEPVDGAWRSDRNYQSPLHVTSQVGWHFDGLSSGIHMEIKYDEYQKELSLQWQGRIVYKERLGELAAYFPMKEWEEKVDYLYGYAFKKQRNDKKDLRKEEIKESKRIKEGWVNKMKEKWGL